ncbi:FAD-binding oxidoreductase [Xanthocytophaga flava]|nr:FAD-binding oxidoreductase [Xanthocytophaga flavus]
MPLTRKKIIRYSLLLLSIIAIIFLVRPILHLTKHMYFTDVGFSSSEKGFTNDVSRLNRSPIDSLVLVSSTADSAIQQLISLLSYARTNHLQVSIAGAKHSMGGHTIAPNGIQVDMLPFRALTLDTTTNILTVGSGALWSEVIPYLNHYNRAVSIMQSDNAFSVGGSISVNCHGWQHNKPPIASTVQSFRLLKVDGRLVTCSRTENEELFSLVLGGYGLFGIIIDVQLQTVPNELYTYQRITVPATDYPDSYQKYIDQNPKARMVYGRLNVNKKDFLQKAMLNYFEYKAPATKDYPLTDPSFTKLKQSIFEGSRNDDYGKELRWQSEKLFTKTLTGNTYSRNQIMNESPALYLNQSATRTDILHEYFIPRKNFRQFIKQLQQIIPQHQADLLNVTIRNVYKDEDTYLRYAREEVFAFVMFFNQPLTSEAEQDMTHLTQELIDAVHKLNGTYYLPYRLHATQNQLKATYPMIDTFFQNKLKYDPQEIFQNKFYQQYKNTKSTVDSTTTLR